jgi:tetratricopeptide (TPR) repeat protein
MQYLKSKDLTNAKSFLEEGKLEEALQLTNKFGKKKNLSYYEKISFYILKCSLAMHFGQNAVFLKYAEMAYQERQKLKESLLLLDVYVQMAGALIYFYKTEQSLEFIAKAEELLKRITEEPSTELLKRKASIAFFKGWVYHDQGQIDDALKCAQLAFEIRERLDLKADVGRSLWQKSFIYFMRDNYLALKHVEKCIKHCEKIGYKKLNQECHRLKGMIYLTKGELNQALKYFKLSRKLFIELPKGMKDDLVNAMLLHLIGMVYQEQGNLDRAKICLEKALTIKTEIGFNFAKMTTLDSLISLTLIQNDLKSAKKYLNELKRVKDQEDNKILNLVYRLNVARMLKLSPLSSDRIKAEEIFKDSLEDKVADIEAKVIAMLNISDILLDRLRKTNEIKLIDQILIYINQIHDIAVSQDSYSLLAEIYLLQAKIELLNLDLKGAQKFLDHAQNITEEYDLKQLNRRIIIEKKELDNQRDKWERLKRSEVNISEIINLAQIGDQLTRMLRKRFVLKNFD